MALGTLSIYTGAVSLLLSTVGSPAGLVFGAISFTTGTAAFIISTGVLLQEDLEDVE